MFCVAVLFAPLYFLSLELHFPSPSLCIFLLLCTAELHSLVLQKQDRNLFTLRYVVEACNLLKLHPGTTENHKLLHHCLG